MINDKSLVGEMDFIKLKMLDEPDEESEWKEELTFEGKVCGFLWFNTRAGKANVVFKELSASYLKEQPVDEKKKEEEEKKKKEEEDKKKEEEKKEEKKEESPNNE